MATESTTDYLAEAHLAYAAHQWVEAYELFRKADNAELTAPDLEAWAQAAWFTALSDEAIGLKERAFKLYVGQGDKNRAGFVAIDLFNHYLHRGSRSIASAWLRRGERILKGQPESSSTGHLALIRGMEAQMGGQIPQAMAYAEDALRIGVENADADLEAFALMTIGSLHIADGATEKGLDLMEEAAVAAVNGELSPFVTGLTCCRMISAARDVTDYRRATEWTEATERCCERQSLAAFPGVCRVHRAEMTALTGAWERAEQELRQATEELIPFNTDEPIADGLYAIGEIRLRQGDIEGAEAALKQAHSYGRTPQPALAMLRFAQGKTRVAAAAINTAVAEKSHDVWARARMLPTQVQLAIANADLDRARSAVEDLTGIVAEQGTPVLKAGRDESRGRLLLAEGDSTTAISHLRSAMREWRDVSAPYEVARVRLILAQALRTAGDTDEADLELTAAHDEFVRLGAKLDAAGVEKVMAQMVDAAANADATHKTFMFTDIVGSTNLAEAMGNEAWLRLIKWHDEMIGDLTPRYGGNVVHSTGDGFFVAFDQAAAAVRAAIAIQQALSEHRRKAGFALPVRIGLHTADANQQGDDYRGIGVHVAARVADLAGSSEILATADTLAEAGDGFEASEPQPTNLKGVAELVAVAAITWEK